MHHSTIALIASLASLANALPAPETTVALSPRCGTFWRPDNLFLLKEDQPDAYLPVPDFNFNVSQRAGTNGGRATGRQYVLVHFPPTPAGSTGCQLIWNIPENTQFHDYFGPHQLEVKTTTGYAPPFQPTWNNIIAGPPPTLGTGVFGVANAVTGTNSVVNIATCNNSPPPGSPGEAYGLGFVFKFADWVEQGGTAAGASFFYGFTGPAGVFKGPYINYNC